MDLLALAALIIGGLVLALLGLIAYGSAGIFSLLAHDDDDAIV